MHNSSTLFKVISFLKPYKLRIAIAATALLIVVGCMLYLGISIRKIIDNPISENNKHNAFNHIIYVITIFGLASFFRSYLINSTAELAANDVKKIAYKKLLYINVDETEGYSISDLSARINSDTDYIARVIIDSTSFFLRNSLTTIGGIFFMFLSSIKLSSITFSIIALLTLFATTLSKNVRNLAKKAEAAKVKSSNLILETIINNKLISAFGKQQHIEKYFLTLNEDTEEKIIVRLKFRSFFFASVITAILVTISIVIWLGMNEISSGKMSNGLLASFVFYAFMTATSFGGIMEMLGEQEKNLANCDRVFELLNLHQKSNQSKEHESIEIPRTGQIILQDISFSYSKTDNTKLFDKASIIFEIGKFNVITGTSGTGKTTLLNILMGTTKLNSGKMIIGKNQYSFISPEMWRGKISYVPQDNNMFTGTILDNLTLFDESITEYRVNEVIRGLLLDNFIDSLPHKLNTSLDGIVSKISGGQKQRIGIARALLSSPDVLILDECTSQLDEETEVAVLGYIKKCMNKKTTICVAHRAGPIAQAESLINL